MRLLLNRISKLRKEPLNIYWIVAFTCSLSLLWMLELSGECNCLPLSKRRELWSYQNIHLYYYELHPSKGPKGTALIIANGSRTVCWRLREWDSAQALVGHQLMSNLEAPLKRSASSSQALCKLPFDFSQGHCLRVLFMINLAMINHGKM